MKETSTLKDYTKKIFASRFSDRMKEKWSGSDTSFANKMNELYERDGVVNRKNEEEFRTCTPQQVYNWKNEKSLPDETSLKYISEILDVEPEFFTYTLFDTGLSPDSPYVKEQDRKFYEKVQSEGIRPEFLDFIRSDELFSVKFPFNPEDRRRIARDDAPKLKKHALVEENGVLMNIDMTRDLLFISELQEEVKRTIDRVYWDKFEAYRLRELVGHFGEILAKMYGVPVDIVYRQYIENPDWFIRTKINLTDQINEDRRALGDLMWNYAIDNKIERLYLPFEPIFTEMTPEIAELNRLRHEDPDELDRIANEQEEEQTEKANDKQKEFINWFNEGIRNGTLKKKERRK